MKPFLSTEPFDPSHPDALAVYCSDGRFTNAIEQLLHHLGHPRLDTLTMAGGPALFNPWLAGLSDSMALTKGARFLIESHRTRRVILVAHEGCGYYRKQYSHASDAALAEHQANDLRYAARTLADGHAPPTRAATSLEILLFHAIPKKGRVAFNPVSLR